MAGRKKATPEKEVVTEEVKEEVIEEAVEEVKEDKPVVNTVTEPVTDNIVNQKPIKRILVTTGSVALRNIPTLNRAQIISFLNARRRFVIEEEIETGEGVFYKLTTNQFIYKNEKNIEIL